MHLQVLASGSGGNATLIRAREQAVLVDAGLPRPDMDLRLQAAGLGPESLDHVLVTHAHLDHARSAGWVARRHRATLHGAEGFLQLASARRAQRLSAITIHKTFELEARRGGDTMRVLPVILPHDCDPTVGYRIEAQGRVAVILTDLGRPCVEVAKALLGAHVLVLEFNHDPELLECGPYPAALRRRIRGERGHLSNDEAARMLTLLAGPDLHTLVLAHLSQKTNRPELALEAASRTLSDLGASHVRTMVASQDEVGESLTV